MKHQKIISTIISATVCSIITTYFIFVYEGINLFSFNDSLIQIYKFLVLCITFLVYAPIIYTLKD